MACAYATKDTSFLLLVIGTYAVASLFYMLSDPRTRQTPVGSLVYSTLYAFGWLVVPLAGGMALAGVPVLSVLPGAFLLGGVALVGVQRRGLAVRVLAALLAAGGVAIGLVVHPIPELPSSVCLFLLSGILVLFGLLMFAQMTKQTKMILRLGSIGVPVYLGMAILLEVLL